MRHLKESDSTSQETALKIHKPHFLLLDGLRGVAALAVLVFHFMEFVFPDPSKNFIAHGYLAVDFFFCLSGFVIAYAYDSKLQRIGVRTFFGLRLIRLHPLVIIGSVLGLLSFLLDPFRNFYAELGLGKTTMMFLTSCLMIPYPTIPQRYYNLFHLNPPTWSLMWEYVANIFYALLLVRITRSVLLVLTGLAAVGLCYVAYTHGDIGVGWGVGNEAGGVARVAASFLLGLLVYRSGWIIKNSLNFPVLSLLLLLAFLIPYRVGFNQFTEPVIVVVYFPLLIALGAGSTQRSTWNGSCRLLGRLSYPLYMIHYPFLWILYSYMEVVKPAANQLAVIMPLIGISLIGFAYFVLTYVDEPIRNYLTKKLIRE